MVLAVFREDGSAEPWPTSRDGYTEEGEYWSEQVPPPPLQIDRVELLVEDYVELGPAARDFVCLPVSRTTLWDREQGVRYEALPDGIIEHFVRWCLWERSVFPPHRLFILDEAFLWHEVYARGLNYWVTDEADDDEDEDEEGEEDEEDDEEDDEEEEGWPRSAALLDELEGYSNGRRVCSISGSTQVRPFDFALHYLAVQTWPKDSAGTGRLGG